MLGGSGLYCFLGNFSNSAATVTNRNNRRLADTSRSRKNKGWH